MEARPTDLSPVVIQILDGAAAGVRDQCGDDPPSPPTRVGGLPMLPAVVESAKDASVVTTVEGRAPQRNPGARRLYGYAATEMLGQPIRNDPDRVVAAVAIAREPSERKRVREELRRAWQEPEKWGAERIVAVGTPNGRDAQCASRPREREARRADFAAIVAHELASPIAAIRYLTRMVTVGGLRPDEQTDALAAICAEAEVLQALVADMESAIVSECEDFAVRLRPIAMAELVAEPITFARTLPGDHPLTTLIDVDDRVLADPQRIGQVLRNLIGNATKYSPPGAPVELRAMRSRSRLRIEVADRGPGIHPDDRRRIFEKFERGRAGRHHRGPGLGLGLYLSRHLVQMHGSKLTVEPRPGGGSIFGFDLEAVG